PSTAYQLTPPVDFRAAVDLLGDDHLIVDSERMLVIFRKGVLNLEVVEGDLESAEQVTIKVLDSSPQAGETENTLVERFLEQVKTTTETDWAEVHNT
ncbi:hypothetical protein CV102_25810, partial [Natronococcus pandeyae]